jgi:hypothetical protein
MAHAGEIRDGSLRLKTLQTDQAGECQILNMLKLTCRNVSDRKLVAPIINVKVF